ncbi:hypothetical protein SAMD00023378_3235 [Ralstonia sp. NT80]|nr:hypothetical protein SAMD00023378_3235 [Ralstonia sp. NT80]
MGVGGHTARSAIPIKFTNNRQGREALPAGPAHIGERRRARAITALTGELEFGIAVPAALVCASLGSLPGGQRAGQVGVYGEGRSRTPTINANSTATGICY